LLAKKRGLLAKKREKIPQNPQKRKSPQMAALFEDQGVPCPPWRHHRAMSSRWLVAGAEDVAVTAEV
jgi:hypothetical protein